jgi:hypothetical protein
MTETNMEKTLRELLKATAVDPRGQEHPDAEILGAFMIGKLLPQDTESVRRHIVSCPLCAQAAALAIRLASEAQDPIPETALKKVRENPCVAEKSAFLEICLRLKDKALELMSSSGDVLAGQELVPAPVLRSRQKSEFPDSVTVLKDFKEVRVEARVDRCAASSVNLSVTARCVRSQSCLKEARVTLIKDSLELESYLAQAGTVCFEHLIAGTYCVDISSSRQKLALIVLDLKT